MSAENFSKNKAQNYPENYLSATPKGLQASLTYTEVSVHDTTIRKTLEFMGCMIE